MRIELLQRLGLEEVKISKGEILIHEGQKTDKVYVLEDGLVTVRKGDKILAKVDTGGTVFGEIAALLKTVHVATVEATKDSTFYVIPDLLEFIRQNPEAGVNVAQVLAVRLVNMNNRFVIIKEDIQAIQDKLGSYLPVFPEDVEKE